MQWLSFPLVKATLFYVLGIFLSASLSVTINTLFILIIALWCILGLLLARNKRQLVPNPFFGVTVLALFVLLGLLNQRSRSHDLNPNNYAHVYDPKESPVLFLKISSRIKSSDYYDKYQAEVVGVGREQTRGKIIVSIKKDSVCDKLLIGSTYATKTGIKPPFGPKNPFQFDYKSYLASQHIYHLLSASRSQFISLSGRDKNLRFWAHTIQQKFRSIIDAKIQDPGAASILKALLVGYKTDLDTDIKENFANAGILHLLAVSGLHVGIVLLLFRQLFGFVKSIKHGPLLLTLICLLAIWSFAAITGFSASVIRAAFMFSLFTIGQQLSRGHNSVNSLFISMLVMLCIDPYLLWQVGFKLSFAAVFFILIVYPRLSGIWTPNNVLLRKLWQLSCVSISAQLGVIPFSLYYFHEFPTLFLISNLALVPMIGILLSVGLVLCTLEMVIAVPSFLFDFLGYWVAAISKFAHWIGMLQYSVIENIFLSKLQATILFAIIFLFSVTIGYSKKYALRLVAFCWSAILVGVAITYHNRPYSEVLLFNQYGQTILTNKQGLTLEVYGLTKEQDQFAIGAYKIARGIKHQINKELPCYFVINGQNVLVVSKPISPPLDWIKVDVLLLIDNPKINLDRWLSAGVPDIIIADASNYKSNVAKWSKSAKLKQIPFYNTAKDGAYNFN